MSRRFDHSCFLEQHCFLAMFEASSDSQSKVWPLRAVGAPASSVLDLIGSLCTHSES